MLLQKIFSWYYLEEWIFDKKNASWVTVWPRTLLKLLITIITQNSVKYDIPELSENASLRKSNLERYTRPFPYIVRKNQSQMKMAFLTIYKNSSYKINLFYFWPLRHYFIHLCCFKKIYNSTFYDADTKTNTFFIQRKNVHDIWSDFFQGK